MTAAVAGRTLWGRVVVALLIGALAAGVCGALGWWQWTRAQTTGRTVQPDPPVALADVLAPAQNAGEALGRQVTVAGTWIETDAAVAVGREVDGRPAQFLVTALEVPAEQTGTGEPATLAVVIGWRDQDSTEPIDTPVGDATLTGYLRAPEASTGASSLPTEDPADGTFWVTGLATSELAQVWPAPMYSAVMVSYDGAPGWTPLEPLPPTTEFNFRSAAYAVEWWLFGAFAVFIVGRWIRDNGRAAPPDPEAAPTTEEPA